MALWLLSPLGQGLTPPESDLIYPSSASSLAMTPTFSVSPSSPATPSQVGLEHLHFVLVCLEDLDSPDLFGEHLSLRVTSLGKTSVAHHFCLSWPPSLLRAHLPWLV